MITTLTQLPPEVRTYFDRLLLALARPIDIARGSAPARFALHAILEIDHKLGLAEVIGETAVSRVSERGATRADDRFSEAAMEDRKREGYF